MILIIALHCVKDYSYFNESKLKKNTEFASESVKSGAFKKFRESQGRTVLRLKDTAKSGAKFLYTVGLLVDAAGRHLEVKG